MRLHWNH
ncbi:unnamed protein product, partial [Allacma fusca]